MKSDTGALNSEELDFINEMMNIGAGNAATALEQMLGLKTDMKIPQVKKYLPEHLDGMLDFVGNPDQLVTAVSMHLVGEITGEIVFVVPDKDRMKLISLVENGTPNRKMIYQDLDPTVIGEIGNIIAGTFLGSIHDFCMLNIYHSLPRIKTETLNTLLRELFPKKYANNTRNTQIILIINEFITATERISTYVLLAPEGDSVERIAQSLRQAKNRLSVP